MPVNRVAVSGLALLLAALPSLPPAAAEDDFATYAQGLAGEAVAYASEQAASFIGLAPSCRTDDPDWAFICSDGATAVGCAADAELLYRCRILLEGSGGDLDGWAAGAFLATASAVAIQGADRAGQSAAHLLGAADDLEGAAGEEAASWRGWTEWRAGQAAALALAAKQPYQDAAISLAGGAAGASLEYARKNHEDAEAKVHEAINDGAHPDHQVTVQADSGPLTLEATDRRPADDPCDPGSGLRVLGSDCEGPVLVHATWRASAQCNAYTAILLSQPCGGHVSLDWTWSSGDAAVPGFRARLTQEPDGAVVVHDAFGSLRCQEGKARYWVQYARAEASASTFDEQALVVDNTTRAALFGEGTCSVAASGSSLRFTYDAQVDGTPLHAEGRFRPEDERQDLMDCGADVDTRHVLVDGCQGVVHT